MNLARRFAHLMNLSTSLSTGNAPLGERDRVLLPQQEAIRPSFSDLTRVGCGP